ncbi:MAG: hypothetical protein ACLSHC_08210 [Bilophila wadsworthia]
MRKNLFATTPGIIIVGAVIGLIAVWLQKLGNPANMGICVACFERDVAGGLGLHRAAIVQYLRPEIMGLVLGSLAAAIARGIQTARGSAPIVRFVLGMIAAMGALVFLGCPWRAILASPAATETPSSALPAWPRGSASGRSFQKGYSLAAATARASSPGHSSPSSPSACSFFTSFSQIPDQPQAAPVLPVKGPGSQHAPSSLRWGWPS